MVGTSQWCVSVWKKDINHRRYQKVVHEIFYIAKMFYKEKDRRWIAALENIILKLDDMSDRRIMPHIRKYLKDFIGVAIQAIKGECKESKLRSEKESTLKLLAIAYCS